MTLLAQTSLLATLITLSIAISILVQGRRRTLLQSYFAYLNINLAICLVATFLLSFGNRLGQVGFYLFLLSYLGVPVTALRFFALLVPEIHRSINNVLRVCYPITILCASIAVTPLSRHFAFLLVEMIYVFGALLVGYILIAIRFTKSTSSGERSRLRPVFLGGFITNILIGLDMISYKLDWPYVFLASIGVAIFMYLLLQLVLATRVIDNEELLGRGAVLGVLSVIMGAIYWVMTFWVGTKQLVPFSISVLVSSIVILILYDPLKEEVEIRVVGYLFNQKREMVALLEQLHRNLVNIIDLQRAAQHIMHTFRISRRVTDASLFILHEDGSSYECIAHVGEEPPSMLTMSNAASLLTALKDSPSPQVRNDLEFRINTALLYWEQEGEEYNEKERQSEILTTMDELSSGLCIPCLSSEHELVGFVSIRDARFEGAFTYEEVNLMMRVAAQVAVTLENSRLFEKVKERERLAVLGEMSAGLAHEIRNPLGAIKGAAQLLNPDHFSESDREMISIIFEEVERLNSVVGQFLNYARPMRIGFEQTDVNHLLRRTIQLIKAARDQQRIRFNLKLDTELPLLPADSERLKQVFLNLLRNSFEAMSEGGMIHIRTELIEENQQEYVRIEVEDEGDGISDEALKNMFIPFYTTKEKGTGLGLAISQRIMEHHDGDIQARRLEPRGTLFTLRFPLSVDENEELSESFDNLQATQVG
jgi:signal transduction histidine kinase